MPDTPDPSPDVDSPASSVEPDAAQAEADFAAGFDGDSSSNSSTATTTPREPLPPAPEEPDEPAQAAPEPPKYRPITEQEYQALMDRTAAVEQIRADNKRAFDTVFGQMGGLKQQMLERLQSQTPAGAPVELTADDLADLNADYPELGERLLKLLQKVAPKLRGTAAAAPPAIRPEAIERLVSERTNTVRKELIDSHLDAVLPDWEEKVKQPEFRPWLNSQPPEIQALEASNSPREAARLLRLYATHLAQPAAKPQAPAAASTRQRRLEAAVNPKSTGGHGPARTEEDEFLAGFNG